MIKSKKGWLRIIEATIAILLIIGSVILVIEKNKPSTQDDLTERFSNLLEEAVKNPELRESITDNSKKENKEDDLGEYLLPKIDSGLFSFKTAVCDISLECPAPDGIPSNKEIYTSERLVTAAPASQNYNPQRVRLFVWGK